MRVYLPSSSLSHQMSAYAILGATGNVGLSILQLLGEPPNHSIHVLVRSRAKLEKLYPSLSSRGNIKVWAAYPPSTRLQNALPGPKQSSSLPPSPITNPDVALLSTLHGQLYRHWKPLEQQMQHFKHLDSSCSVLQVVTTNFGQGYPHWCTTCCGQQTKTSTLISITPKHICTSTRTG